MGRDDTEPDEVPRTPPAPPPPPTDSTAPLADPPTSSDLRSLSSLLARLDALGATGDPSGSDSGDSTALLREIRDCLRVMEGGWPLAPSPPGDGPRRVGRFELLEVRGRGGFGIVYRAFDPLLRRVVALKVPRIEGLTLPELRRRFLREARAAGALEHPNIVPVFEAGEDGPLCYLAAAFVDGPTLSAWLRSRAAPVPLRDAASLIATMADAVRHAHDRGVLHRDLKPSNVLLQGASEGDGPGPPPTPRLTDFGLAKLIEEAGDESRSGVPMGSPSYMSPEQAAGKHREVGRPADVYGLGAILYELIAGRPPHRGESQMETIALVLSEEPIAPRLLRPGLSRELETICLTCLRKDPARRYASAAALAADLRRWMAGEAIVARPASAWERVGCWARRRPGLAAAIVLASAVGAVAAGGLVAYNSRLASHRRQLEVIAGEAREQHLLAERRFDAARLRLASEALNLGEIERAQEILDDLRPRLDGPGGFAWDYIPVARPTARSPR